MTFRWLLIPLFLCGCDSPNEQRSPGESTPAASESAPVPPPAAVGADTKATSPIADERAAPEAVQHAGVHATSKGTALAFQPGATLADTQEVVSEAVAGGLLTVGESSAVKEDLAGSVVMVNKQALDIPAGPVASVRLTYFNGILVSVIQTFRQPQLSQLAHYLAELGPPVEHQQWAGWWDQEGDRVIMARRDGVTIEYFDLASARDSVANIDLIVGTSWQMRFQTEPPGAGGSP